MLWSARGNSTRYLEPREWSRELYNLKEEPRPPRMHKQGHQKLRAGLRGEYEKALIPL